MANSETSLFRPTGPTGRWVVFFGALVIVVLLAEVGVRLVRSGLDEPLGSYTAEMDILTNEIATLNKAGIGSDMAFVGSSMIGRAVFPELVEDRFATVTNAHNLGLPAASTEVVQRFATDVMLDKLAPKCVVWGLSSMDVNGGRQPQRTIELYDEAIDTRPGVLGTIERQSAILRYRPSLYTYLRTGEAVPADDPPAWVAPPGRDRSLADMGDFDKSEWTSTRNEFETRRLEDEVLAGFEIGDREMEAFRQTIELLDAEADLIIVSMPVPPSYRDRHPSPDDFDKFRQWLAAETDRAGATLVDTSDWMTEADFHDYTHMERESGEAFTQRLADELQALDFCS